MIEHHAVGEAAVVGVTDELTGQAVNAFVALKDANENVDALRKELILQVRKSIGPFAAPKNVFIVPDLPKTRSGKIMRRILRKILAGEEDQLGDTSTVSPPPNPRVTARTEHHVLTTLVAVGSQRGPKDHWDCPGIAEEVIATSFGVE